MLKKTVAILGVLALCAIPVLCPHWLVSLAAAYLACGCIFLHLIEEAPVLDGHD